jgi:hypothetical protein
LGEASRQGNTIALAQMAIEPSRHVAVDMVPFLLVGDFWMHDVNVAFKLILALKKEIG